MNKPDNVNDSQWQAVIHDQSHLLIIAGPGTGKTHTLVHRIERIIPQLSSDQKVLGITFTNKAAGELLDRLDGYGIERNRAFIGTFHQFCLNILREYQMATNLPKDFSVATPKDVEKVLKKLWPDATKGKKKDILDRISSCKSGVSQKGCEEVKRYNECLREKRLLDFDDLIVETVQLLKSDEEILESLHQIYRRILVDEYQDINSVQYELIKLLVADGIQLTAIGDPNQAIYGFRGSSPNVFNQMKKDFLGVQTVSLTENYRSAQGLLVASGQVIADASNASPLEVTAKIYREGRLTVYEAQTEKAEAEYVVHSIEKLVGGTSMFSQDSGRVDSQEAADISFGDVAVLYRLHAQGHELKKAFERSGIPYHMVQPKSAEEFEECPQRGEETSFDGEKVSLMTFHAAKGLEFSTVFMVGCEECLLPLELPGLTSDIEEERRLFYVGMTRAKENLFMTHATKRCIFGQNYTNKISPFVLSIEEELKKYDKPVKALKPKSREQQLSLFN